MDIIKVNLEENDFRECACGNQLWRDGSEACLRDGTKLVAGPWPERLLKCVQCEQIYELTSPTFGDDFISNLGKAFLLFPIALGPIEPEGDHLKPVPELRETVHNWRDPGAEKRNRPL